ncbi:AMIN-like domain-containing (lipo)protein [Streptosporangium sp. NPDC002607]
MNRTLVPLVPLVLLPLFLLAGCGSDTQTAPPSSGVPATAAPADPAVTPTSTPAGPRPPTSTKEIEVERTTVASPAVTGARFGRHQGFDRVVIDLNGDVPGYTVRWVPELVQDGSGDRVDVEGGAYLQLTMSPAIAHTEAGKPTWTGGPIFQAQLGNVQSVVKTGDFEGVVSVGIVLDRRAPFRVLEQKNPNRLVIDVAH